MKNLAIIITGLFLLPIVALSQLNGNGTESQPYYGTISINTVWQPDNYPDQTIYCLGIIINSGATLTISPGAYSGGLVQFYSGYSITIESSCSFIIQPRTAVTVDDIINNGTLRLESYSNEGGVASLINDTYDETGGGTTQLRLYLSGGTVNPGVYKWHYITVPIFGTNVSTFTSSTNNVAQYIESLVTSPDNYPGWVAFDGYQYSSGNILATTFSTLTVGKGYNYYCASNNTYTFAGAINIQNRSVAVTCGSGYPDYQGYNLIGNPFSSSLDWDYLMNNNPPAYVNNAIYFTNNGRIASYVSGIGVDGGTGTIPPMQGFFVKATAGSFISLRTSARTHNLDQMRYKKKSTVDDQNIADTISFIRIKLKSLSDSTDLVVRFNDKATDGVDKMFDAYEFNRSAGDLNIWTVTNGVDYSINGLPFPTAIIEIPVGLNLKTQGSFTLSSNELKRLDNFKVTLKDLVTDKYIDLKKAETIEFTSPEGLIDGRFILAVSNTTTAVPDQTYPESKFSIYSSGPGIINIRSLTDEFTGEQGSIIIYDLTGRTMLQMNNVAWHGAGDMKELSFNESGQKLYIVEVKTPLYRFTKKISLLQ